jgi:hypothetical protein
MKKLLKATPGGGRVTAYTVLMADLSAVTVDGYRATTETCGAMSLSAGSDNVLLAAGTWVRCAPADVTGLGW